MGNTTYGMIKLISIAGLLLVLSACGENHGLKEETFLFAERNEDWIVTDSSRYQFIMQDENGISDGFSLIDSSYYFNKSWSSVLGITTHISYKEFHYQNFTSTYGQTFHLSLTAGFPPFGDHLYFGMDDIALSYDLAENVITRINVFNSHKSLIMTNKGYEQDEEIRSKVEMLYNLAIGDITYPRVLHFKLEDFTEELYKHSVKEIFLAMDYGLVKYVLNSGLELIRIQ